MKLPNLLSFVHAALRAWALLCFACGLCSVQVHAQVASQVQPSALAKTSVVTIPAGTKKFNLRPVWGEKIVPVAQAMSADKIMALPADQFAPDADHIAASLGYDKELWLRTQLRFEDVGKDWMLAIPMSRLDEVFVHFRFADNVWHTAHMGDKVPYTEWPFVNTNPAVKIMGPGNTLDVLIQVRHGGRFTAPVWIESDATFRFERLRYGVYNGLIIGFMIATALACVLAGRALGNRAFYWTALQSFLFALAIVAYQGYGDAFIWGDASPWWRDQSKLLVSLLVLASMLPMSASALSLHTRDRFLWRASHGASVLAVLAGLVICVYLPAQMRVPASAVVCLFVLTCVAWLCFNAVRHGERIANWACMGFGLYAVCVIATALDNIVSFRGLDMPTLAPFGYAVGTLLLIFGLMNNHRFGKTMRKQDIETNRLLDELTGLPNREGLDKEYAHQVLQLRSEHATAVFIMVRFARADELAQEQGRERFEDGIVSLSAALVGCMLPGETLARLDDATFAIIASEHNDSASADQLAAQILARCMVAQPSGKEVSARLVVLPIPAGGSLVETVLHKCESALLAAPTGKRIIKLHANGRPVNSGIQSV